MNSTALLLLLTNKGEEFETVFVNHGGDYPETYEYVNYLRALGYTITEITPFHSGCTTIEDYILKYNFFPTSRTRWCTLQFKVNVLYNYFEKPCADMIAFSIDESKRCKNYKRPEGITVKYPLIEKGITRAGCIDIIKAHDIKVPTRSACWMCPFMAKKEVRRLFLENYPLYEKRKNLEKHCMKKQREPFYISRTEKSVTDMAMEDIPSIENYL